MKLPEQDYLIRLLSAVMDNVQPQTPPKALDWEKLYRLSVWHNVSNMAWYGIMKLNPEHRPPQDILMKFKNDYKMGMAKEATQHLTVEQIYKTFEEHRISCLPVKGCLIKYLYPRPDMRLMADIDILIKNEQAEQARGLMPALGYTVEHWGGNHDIYHRKPFMNIEIHRRLVSEDSPYSAYLGKTWDRAVLKPGCKYIYRLSHEDIYIYLVIHLTKHYAGGGTGIRSFMDIWVYNKRYGDEMDWDYIEAELEKVGIRKFADNVRGIGEVWFGGGQSSELYEEMTEYIFSSGAYGALKQSFISPEILAVKKRLPAKCACWMKLIFPTVETLKSSYPILEALPFLLPFCWLLWGAGCLLFKRRLMFQLIGVVHSVSGDDIARMERLHKRAGLL